MRRWKVTGGDGLYIVLFIIEGYLAFIVSILYNVNIYQSLLKNLLYTDKGSVWLRQVYTIRNSSALHSYKLSIDTYQPIVLHIDRLWENKHVTKPINVPINIKYMLIENHWIMGKVIKHT